MRFQTWADLKNTPRSRKIVREIITLESVLDAGIGNAKDEARLVECYSLLQQSNEGR